MTPDLTNKKTIAVNAIAAAIAKVLNVLVLLWAQHKLLVNLPADAFSIYPLVASFLFFLPLVNTLFTSPAQRFTTLAYANDKKEDITKVVSTVFPLVLVFCLLFALIGLLVTLNLEYLFRIADENLLEAKYMFGLIVISSIVQLLMKPFSVAFFATQRLALFHAISLAGELIKLVILLCLFSFYSYRVVWLVLADTCASCLLAVTLALISRGMISEIRVRWSSFDRSRIRDYLSFGLADVGINCSRLLRAVTPVWLLNRFATPLAVNSFHLGQSAYRQSQKAWIPLRGTMGPPMIAMYARGEMDRIRRTYYRGSKLALWAILMVCTPLFSFAPEVLEHYAGSQYKEVAWVMIFLLLRYPFQLANALLPQVARAFGQPNRIAIPMIIGELLAAITIFVLIAGFDAGALGAAIASVVITSVVELFVLLPIGLNMIEGRVSDTIKKSLVPGLVPCIVGLVVGLTLRLTAIETVTQLLLMIATVWVSYVVVVFLMFDQSDWEDFRRVVDRVGSKFRFRNAT